MQDLETMNISTHEFKGIISLLAAILLLSKAGVTAGKFVGLFICLFVCLFLFRDE